MHGRALRHADGVYGEHSLGMLACAENGEEQACVESGEEQAGKRSRGRVVAHLFILAAVLGSVVGLAAVARHTSGPGSAPGSAVGLAALAEDTPGPGAAASDAGGACKVLWSLSVSDMVGGGFGARMLLLPVTRLLAAQHGCDIIVSERTAAEWQHWNLSKFWARALPPRDWGRHWRQAQVCGQNRWLGLRCEWPDSRENFTLKNAPEWILTLQACDDEFSAMLLETFRPRLSSYRPLYKAPYAGLHVRHGDKATEGRVFPFRSHVRALGATRPDVRRIFVATDDADVISAGVRRTPPGGGLTFRWTAQERRAHGGTRRGLHGHHRNGSEAVAAVLDDIAGLALARVLVGSLNSYFFKLAWFLNMALQSTPERPAPWCHDLYSNHSCDDRPTYIEEVSSTPCYYR